MSSKSGSGPLEVVAPMAATVSALVAEVGEIVEAGAPLVVLEVMKMEHPVHAPERCRVVSWAVDVDEQVEAGDHLAAVEVVFDDIGPAIEPDAGDEVSDGRDGEGRSDLAELARRRSLLADEARPEAVSKRHGRGGRTARENVTDLLDEGSFQEYGGFAFAAQESRRGRADLEANTPADGMVTGIGRVNSALVGAERAAVSAGVRSVRCAKPLSRLEKRTAEGPSRAREFGLRFGSTPSARRGGKSRCASSAYGSRGISLAGLLIRWS